MKVSFIYEIAGKIYYIGHGKILKSIENRIPYPYNNYFKEYKEFIQEYQKEDRNFNNEYLNKISRSIYSLINESSAITDSNDNNDKYISVNLEDLDQKIKSKIDELINIFSDVFYYLNINQRYPDTKNL
jgi:hypothetical protein